MLTQTICVLGAGTMGRGIAQLMALAGHEVRLFDAAPDGAKAALNLIRDILARQVDKGILDDAARAKALRGLTIAPSARIAADGVDIVIEAIVESMDQKVALFTEIASVLPASALVASNTSSLSITEIGARIGFASRTVGMHFFNPVHAMELVEVVRGYATDEASVERAVGFARALGKTPIVVRDVPGFATSRLGVLLGCEAMRMVESQVASAHDIDRGMELGYRHPMGPLKLTDLVGLDVRLAILEHLHRELGEQFRPPPLLRTMVRAGKLGKKSGEGFYLWRDGEALPKP